MCKYVVGGRYHTRFFTFTVNMESHMTCFHAFVIIKMRDK